MENPPLFYRQLALFFFLEVDSVPTEGGDMRFTIERSKNARIPASFAPMARGYDPELMIVECAHCGRPVLWEPGRSTEVLAGVGIDPLELDAQS